MYTTAQTLGIKVGDRPKNGARYVEVLEISTCGQYVRVRGLASKKVEWVIAEHLTSREK